MLPSYKERPPQLLPCEPDGLRRRALRIQRPVDHKSLSRVKLHLYTGVHSKHHSAVNADIARHPMHVATGPRLIRGDRPAVI